MLSRAGAVCSSRCATRATLRALHTSAAPRTPTRVRLEDRYFPHAGTGAARLVESGDSLRASLFRYGTGVCGVRVENGVGTVDLLPFQGQAIWRASFHGQELTMKSMFDEPRPVSPNKQWGYIDTYGAFMLHCGALAMGCPGPEDTHQLHGELPNAGYQQAWLACGEDERGRYIEMSGHYDHTTAFTHNYRATPSVKVYEGDTVMPIALNIANRFHKPMDLMYMCHINFRPVEGARLVYSAPSTPDSFAVRSTFPDHVKPSAEHKAFLARLAADPSIVDNMTAEVMACLDPEVVAYLEYKAGEDGWAHSMQVLPGGGAAHYVKHKPAQLDKGVRWMVCDGSHGAMGLVLPATAHPEGHAEESRKGNVRELGAGQEVTFEVEAGLLPTAAAVGDVQAQVSQLLQA